MSATLLAPQAWYEQASRYARFLVAWVRRPLTTASIVPSSARLGRLMASAVDPAGGPVMEFGGGTGALTREILRTGLPAEKLEIIEMDAALAAGLRADFAGTRVIEAGAQHATAHAFAGPRGYQAVISGLPLLTMNAALQEAILAEALALLEPGGGIYQFTYSPRSPVRWEVAEALGLKVERVGSVLRNVPPATVFRLSADVDAAQSPA